MLGSPSARTGRLVMRHTFVIALLGLWVASPALSATPASESTKPVPPNAALVLGPVELASDVALGNGCWARLYLGDNFSGSVLTLVGPLEVDYLRPDWGFAWDARYESLRVGPRGTLTTYDDVQFRDRSASFGAHRSIPDLDQEMGVFRRIRSLKVSCG